MSIFTRYRVSIKFRDKVCGGVPKDPKLIEAWLRKRMGLGDDEELADMLRRTLRELGVEVPENASREELIKASEKMASKNTCGFKRGSEGLYLEGRIVKAMLKESCNILYGSKRWGPTSKGPKGYLAERVFVEEDRIPLGREEPDSLEMFIGHVSGPQGERSTLTYYEYCYAPECSFTVSSFEQSAGRTKEGNDLPPVIDLAVWTALLEHGQENGLGALRSQSYGRFDVLDMVRLPPRKWSLVVRDAAS